MEAWIFQGRVLPERIPVRISQPIEGEATVPTFGLSYKWSYAIADSQIVADLTITKGNTDLNTLKNLLEDHIRSMLDLIGYQQGVSFDVEIVSAVNSIDKTKCVFGIAIPVLQQRRKDSQLNQLSTDTMIAIAKEPHAQIVLADFREAMRIPTGTGFFCYRAIEAMMQSMRNGSEEKVAWPRLRERLRIDRGAIDYVKSHGDFPRHGRPSEISDSERAKVFEITDLAIERFLAYLEFAPAPLNEKKYPVIKI